MCSSGTDLGHEGGLRSGLGVGVNGLVSVRFGHLDFAGSNEALQDRLLCGRTCRAWMVHVVAVTS